MALGGFKFAGYKCTKPEGATYAQWALLIHKARLRAFLAANTLAGNVWVQDWNGGTIDLDTGDGLIYDITSNSLNLVSFFKHNSEDKYLMIATLSDWCAPDNSSHSEISLRLANGAAMSGQYNSSSQSKIGYKTLFHVLSYERFPVDCLLYSANNYPSQATELIPVSGWYYEAQTSNYVKSGLTGTYVNDSTSLYIGYAIREKDLICLSSNTLTILNNVMPDYFQRASLIGFDGMNLSSPNDTANIYGLSFNVNQTRETNATNWTGSVINFMQETLTSGFSRYPISSVSSTLFLTESSKAAYGGSPSAYPFESVTLTTGGSRPESSPQLNSDGIASKGTFSIDVLACNCCYTQRNTLIWNAFANGNYLMVAALANSSSYSRPGTAYFVGWDPSNPDITSESAWTAYNG